MDFINETISFGHYYNAATKNPKIDIKKSQKRHKKV